MARAIALTLPRRFSPIERDWRFRTVAPVILIHALAFAALYVVSIRLLVDRLVDAHQGTVDRILDEAALELPGTPLPLPATLARFAALHGASGATLHDASGRLLATAGEPRVDAVRAIAERLGVAGNGTSWLLRPGNPFLLAAAHRLDRPGAPAALPRVLVLELDLTAQVDVARTGLALHLALVLLVWGSLSVIAASIRRTVIGRPIERIGRAVRGVSPAGEPGDLDALADRLDTAILELLERQKRQDADVTAHMARAEQLAALGEVAAGLTHEIRSPLAGISAALEVLRDEAAAGSPDRAEVLDRILGEISRVGGTVEGLLRLARPDVPHREPVDLSDVARRVVQLLEPQARRRRVRIDVASPGAVPILPLDPNLMTQLFLNLLTNALHAVPDGGTIAVAVTPFPRRNGVLATVSDDGPGIPSDRIADVFRVFWTSRPEGTGLGLPICRTIVEQHGGRLTLESEPGKGTRVLVVLPDPAEPEGRWR